MKFYSVNKFVEAIMAFAPDTEYIFVFYSMETMTKDKFGKFNVVPVYIILDQSTDKKTTLWTEDIKLR